MAPPSLYFVFCILFSVGITKNLSFRMAVRYRILSEIWKKSLET